MIPKNFPWTDVPLRELPFVILDLETTGLEPPSAAITEIAMISTTNGNEEVFETLINPGTPIPPEISRLTGITDQMVQNKPRISEVLPFVASILDGGLFVSHNVPFDWSFLSHAFSTHLGRPLKMPSLCTLHMARRFLNLGSNRLCAVIDYFGETLKEAHRAIGDTMAVKAVLFHFLEFLEGKGIKTGGDLVRNNVLFLDAPPVQRRYSRS